MGLLPLNQAGGSTPVKSVHYRARHGAVPPRFCKLELPLTTGYNAITIETRAITVKANLKVQTNTR